MSTRILLNQKSSKIVSRQRQLKMWSEYAGVNEEERDKRFEPMRANPTDILGFSNHKAFESFESVA